MCNRPSRGTVLVIDDDESIRELITFALEDDGYTVVCAPEGETALRVLPELDPDVILLDSRMPVIDGRDFARAYRDSGAARAPLIILTAVEDPESAAAEVGADAYLSKPFDLADLSSTVGRFLPENAG